MIKVFCIEDFKNIFSKKEIKKEFFISHTQIFFDNTWDVIPIFEEENSDNLLASFLKIYFITLDE